MSNSFRRLDSPDGMRDDIEISAKRQSRRIDNGQQAWDEGGLMQQHQHKAEVQDALRLARLGKKQVLKRNFDFVSMFAFTSVVIISWECTSLTLSTIPDIGASSFIYGLIIVFLGTMATFTTVGELASMATTAGGQHHWVFMMTPEPYRRLTSYLIGSMAIFSWILFFASNTFAAGTIIQGMIVLHWPDYQPEAWHGTLLIWAVIGLIVFFNTTAAFLLPVIECAFLVVHVLGFLAVFIILCYMPAKGDAGQVFQAFASPSHSGDGSGSISWPEGLSLMIGLAALVFPFQGADATVHLCEEMHDAAVNVPRSMLASVAVDGLTAIALVIATVYGYVLIDHSAAADSKTGYAFLYFYQQVTGNAGGAVAMAAIVLVAIIASATSVATAASRLIWAFARDNALPWSRIWARVDPGTLNPANAVLLVNGIALLISLINLGSSAVLNSIFAISTAGFYSTYLACAGLLLWHRLSGGILEPGSRRGVGSNTSANTTVSPNIPIKHVASNKTLTAATTTDSTSGNASDDTVTVSPSLKPTSTSPHTSDPKSNPKRTSKALDPTTTTTSSPKTEASATLLPDDDNSSSILTINAQTGAYGIRLVWGPWRLPEWLGVSINVAACLYLVIVIFFSVWPSVARPDPGQANWSLLVLAAVVAVSGGYYRVSARWRYRGPVVEVVL